MGASLNEGGGERESARTPVYPGREKASGKNGSGSKIKSSRSEREGRHRESLREAALN